MGVSIAAVAAMSLVFMVGTLLDKIGRRRGAVVVFGITPLGVFSGYSLHDP
jgi:putative MFS transporter